MLITKAQLGKASLKELQQISAAIKLEIGKRENNTKANLLKQVKKLAADAGVSINDLLGSSPKGTKAVRIHKVAGKPRGKVAPKYRNPADASQTWTGRGRQPLWVSKAVAAGKSLETLLIK
jgi:DNA-binding protein H-NS